MSTAYDAIIIGAGQAGPPLAGRLAAAGQRVALIERKLFGGTCVNTGCTPTKTLVASAYAAHMARRAAEFGVQIGGPVTVDMAAVKARKDAVIGKSRAGVEAWLAHMAGCTVVRGHARFLSPDTVSVDGQSLTAPQIFIDVGGRARIPAFPGVDRVPVLTNTSILDLDTLPEHLVVIGGSYIGLEFAQIFRRFGSAVTIVEQGPRLIQREDADVSTAVQDILEREGIAVRTGAECIQFTPRGDHIGVGVTCTAGAPEIVGSHVLLAVGRQPNTADLGLDRAGVAVDDRGYITVDDFCRTSVPGIWAMGDCNGRGAFTHTTYNDYEIVAANLLDGDKRRIGDRITDYALYIDPPLGRAGLTEAEALQAGHSIRVGKRMMTRVGRAVEKGEALGFMKVVVDAASGLILGGAILGVGGDEAIHSVLGAMAAGLPYTALQRTVPIHPTVSELIPTILGELQP